MAMRRERGSEGGREGEKKEGEGEKEDVCVCVCVRACVCVCVIAQVVLRELCCCCCCSGVVGGGACCCCEARAAKWEAARPGATTQRAKHAQRAKK